MIENSCQNLFHDITLRNRRKTAISFYSLMGKKSLSYGDLLHEVTLIQSNIVSFCKQSQPNIIFSLDNNASSVSLYLACIGLGATIIPINPSTVFDEIDYIVTEHSPSLIICNPESELEDTYNDLAVSFNKLLAPCNSDTINYSHANESRLIVHTSGTTGRPKGVVLSFNQVVGNARLIVSHTGLNNESQLTTLPMYHVHAIVFGIFSSLVSNSHLVYTNRFNPIVWIKAMRTEKIVWSSIVPSLLPSLSSMKLGKDLSDHLKGIIVSSAPILEDHAVEFEKSTGVPVLQAWGQSEFTCWATCCQFGFEGQEYDGSLRSVGYPLESVRVTVRDDNGNEQDEGVSGILYIDGPFKMLEYFGQDSSDTITDYGVDTGDVGYWKSINRRRYFFVSGRKKEIINRAGEKLSPVAIEEHIYREYPDMYSKIAIVGFPHHVVGEEIGIVISETHFSSAEKKNTFARYLSSIHESIRPRVACFINHDIEMTATGKIKRSQLTHYFELYSTNNDRFSVLSSRY